MRWKLFTLMLLGCPLALAGPIYKWVDENGVIHYSDQPHENAQQIHLGTPQTYKPTQYAEPDAAASAAPAGSYKCAVTSPTDQQDFPNADTVSVSAQVDPPPSGDNQIFVMLDGRVVTGQPTDSLQFTLNVERGEHSVAVVMRDGSGKVVCQSAGVTFFVRQPSVLAPTNPNNPANQPTIPTPRPH
jgi:hypothetical protein